MSWISWGCAILLRYNTQLQPPRTPLVCIYPLRLLYASPEKHHFSITPAWGTVCTSCTCVLRSTYASRGRRAVWHDMGGSKPSTGPGLHGQGRCDSVTAGIHLQTDLRLPAEAAQPHSCDVVRCDSLWQAYSKNMQTPCSMRKSANWNL